ncbi:MAG: hypothetical protein ACK4HR_05570 [Hyphomonas sp.]
MIRGFTFERALSWPFTAPHAATFPLIFGLAYAAVFMGVLALVGTLAFTDLRDWITLMEGLENETDPARITGAMWGGMTRLIPWGLLTLLLSWAVWAMFETASQRRYIRGEGFSLGFGADEMRMMVVGLLWWLIGVAVIFLPLLLIMGSAFWAIFSNIGNPEVFESEDFGNRMAMQMLGTFGLMLLVLPVYVFVATRLAPCFGLTLMSRRIRFFDAWNVSRGRFWPILGAYLILAIAGGIIGQVIAAVAQVILMPSITRLVNVADSGGDVGALFRSPEFLAPAGLFYFLALAVQGVLQHIVGGPAAFAARHDPDGGVEETARVDAFV